MLYMQWEDVEGKRLKNEACSCHNTYVRVVEPKGRLFARREADLPCLTSESDEAPRLPSCQIEMAVAPHPDFLNVEAESMPEEPLAARFLSLVLDHGNY